MSRSSRGRAFHNLGAAVIIMIITTVVAVVAFNIISCVLNYEGLLTYS